MWYTEVKTIYTNTSKSGKGVNSVIQKITKNINWRSVAQLVFVLAFAIVPFVASAQGLLPADCPPGTRCQNVDARELINTVINWILGITLAVDVLMIIIGGFIYITSGGSETAAKRGRTIVLNAIYGLIIIILAYVIANVVANFFTS